MKACSWTGSVARTGADAPFKAEGACVWNNTADQINRIQVSMDSASTYNAGSFMAVYGMKE
jgi:hypothetical protein